jgi:organic radical activating enzyme
MIPIKVISTQAANTLQIRFFPTDICNFDCSYCFPGSHEGKYRFSKDVNLVIKNFRILLDTYKTIGKTKFHVTLAGGGEPTMWPGIEQFCKEIKESHDCFITIVTNGSRTVRWWEENSAYFDDAVLSCHNEFVDIEHYVKVADLLFAAGINVTGLMLMDAANWDRCVSYIERMQASEHPWYIETKPVVEAPGHGVDMYTEEQLTYIDGIKRIPDSKWLMKRLHEFKIFESVVLFDDNTAHTARPHEIITNNWNHFKGWTCNVGFEGISITANGNVHSSCRVMLFNNPINIFSNDFAMTEMPSQVTCPFDTCACQPETHITKFL